MDTPANTTTYMIAGFAVIFGGLMLYLSSLARRYRQLQQQEKRIKADAEPPEHPSRQDG